MESPTWFNKRGLALISAALLGGLTAYLAWPPATVALPEMRRAAAHSSYDREPITALPDSVTLDSRKVALGERLFHDPRLSADETISCASCHPLGSGGMDGSPRSTGIGGARGKVNAPTVFNSGFNFRQFWDGRAASLEEQVSGPVHNPKEMGTDWQSVLDKLRRDRDLVDYFTALYGDGLQSRNIQDAIATFERSLVTPSRFDRFLGGERDALNAQEQAGYRKFKDYGCTACHQGKNIGGNMYQSFGIFGNYFHDRGKNEAEDQGRYNVTLREEDRYRFKVPSLRNVALTAPYFHDGSVARLEEAIRVMARYQLGRMLEDGDVADIAAFLKSLNGTYRGKPL